MVWCLESGAFGVDFRKVSVSTSFSKRKWSGRGDLNSRPLAPQASFWLFSGFSALPVVASKVSFMPLPIRLSSLIYKVFIASGGNDRKKHLCESCAGDKRLCGMCAVRQNWP